MGMLRFSLDLREELLGNSHACTLTNVDHLARVLRAQGKLQESEACFRRVLEQREKSLGPEHESTVIARANVDHLSQATGNDELVSESELKGVAESAPCPTKLFA